MNMERTAADKHEAITRALESLFSLCDCTDRLTDEKRIPIGEISAISYQTEAGAPEGAGYYILDASVWNDRFVNVFPGLKAGDFCGERFTPLPEIRGSQGPQPDPSPQAAFRPSEC